MGKRSPRLQFAEEERSAPEMEKVIRKADKAADRLEKAEAKIPKKTVKVKERVVDSQGRVTTRLHFEEVDKKKPPSKLSHAVTAAPANTVHATAHRRIRETEEDNVGTESAHKMEEAAEGGVRTISSAHRSHKLKPYRNAARAEAKADKANIKALNKQSRSQNPQFSSNPYSRWQQKRAIKKEYMAAKKSGSGTIKAGQTTAKAAKKTAETTKKTAQFVAKNWKGVLIGLGLLLIVAFLLSAVSSCSVLVQGGVSAIGASSYATTDDDMKAAEAQYCALEAELQRYLDTYESTHDYDEYHYDLDEIEHDPYVLISILSAIHGNEWSIADVGGTLQMLFEKQYILTETVRTETRYRTETRTGTRSYTDPDTGETVIEEYEYEVEVPYTYYICTVELENFNLSHVPVYILSQDQLAMYATFMGTLGNRPDLFPDSSYVGKYYGTEYEDYEIPAEALSNERFAAIMEEAEKYLGYDERYAKWSYNDLPIVPADWKYKIPKDKYKQFATIKHLMHREDVTAVINACDAGREGELIFRNIYNMAGCTKPIYRLWISSMEDSAIRQGFAELKSGKEYDNLYAAARCREWADWLVGINATRLFSVLYHRTLNVGRVVSPTLALLVQREAEIDAFKPEPFYTAELNFGSFTTTSEKFQKKSDAKAVISYDGTAVVKSVVSKEKSEKAPALYDLTTLQREANRQHGYTAQQTLDYVQSLYEKKLCTYPRTDSRYLTDDMESGVSATVNICATICDTDAPSAVQSKQVCDSKKVTDHHAIIPTAVAGKTDITVLPAGEREILTMISKLVLRAVSGKYRYCETVAEIAFGDTVFTAKGKTVIDIGWKAYNETEQSKKVLPELHDGDELNVEGAEVKEGMTKPLAHFTEDALLSAMEVVGAKEMPDDAETGVPTQPTSLGLRGEKEGQRNKADARRRAGEAECSLPRRGLGTPATRAGIIEKLIATGFVERKKAKKTVSLIPAGTGVSLITVLPEQLQSPLLTAEWEHKLKLVEHGELDADEFMAEISRMVSDLVKTYTAVKGAEVLFPSGREVIGKCPRCGGDVTESKKGFFCETNSCRFGLWRDNKFLTAKKISMTRKTAATLLKNGRIPIKGIYSEKTGKSYDATLVMTDDGAKTLYSFDFSK